MPHIPGHNPFYNFQEGGTSQSIPSISNLLPPPQPTTSITQVNQPDPPRKKRGGFFDPLISKEAVQKKVTGSDWFPDFAEPAIGQVLGTAAEYTTSPFDIALIPTWAIGGPTIATALKGARTLAYFPKGLKWFPKVLGSVFDPFPGTISSLPLRMIAETGASIGGGVLANEGAEFGEDLGGTPGAIVGGILGGFAGGTVGGFGAVGTMKGIGKSVKLLRGGDVKNVKKHPALYSMVTGQTTQRGTPREGLGVPTGKSYFPVKSALELEIDEARVRAKEESIPFEKIWIKKDLKSNESYYEAPEWINKNLGDLMPDLIPATWQGLIFDPHEKELTTTAELEEQLNFASVDGADLAATTNRVTKEVAASKLGRSATRMDKLSGGLISKMHRLGNPMSKSNTLIEVISTIKNMGDKNAALTAFKLYEWTGLWKMDKVFGATDKDMWTKVGDDIIGNEKVGSLKDGTELKEAAKKAGIFEADNLSVLRILEETRPLEDRWYTVKKGKGNVIDGSRDYRKLLNDDQKKMLRRIALANKFADEQMAKFGIDTGVKFTTKSALELSDVFGWTKKMFDDAIEEQRATPLSEEDAGKFGWETAEQRNDQFDQDVNYANRRIVMHKDTNDIAIIGKDNRVWKMGKKIGAEQSRQFNRITTGEAAGYVYMPLDSAFIIGNTSKQKRILYKTIAKYFQDSIQKGSYEEYKDIDVIDMRTKTREELFRQMRNLYPKKYSDKKINQLIELSRGGDLDIEPEIILMRDEIWNVLPQIKIIRDKIKTGESVRGLVGSSKIVDVIDTLKRIYAEYPHMINDPQGNAISDLFDDKDGMHKIKALKEIIYDDKSKDESFELIMKALKIENEDEAAFLMTLAQARRIMGDDFIMKGGKIKDVDLNKITEIIEGRRIGTAQDTEDLKRLIHYYKNSVTEEATTTTTRLKTQLDTLNNVFKRLQEDRIKKGDITRDLGPWYERPDDLNLGLEINDIQAQIKENERLVHIYNKYDNNQSLNVIDEDFKMGLKYKKDGYDAEYSVDVFAKEQERLLNEENISDIVAVQAEDEINLLNEYIDLAIKQSRQQINWNADINKVDDALVRVQQKLNESLNGYDYLDEETGFTRRKDGILKVIEKAEIKSRSGLTSVIFTDQPDLDEMIFKTKLDAPMGAHDTLMEMRADFEAIFEVTNPSKLSRAWTSVNAVQRMVALGFDASIFMIQLFPVMMNHPKIMPKVFTGYFKALLKTWQDPEAGKRMMFEYRAKPENQAILNKYGKYLLMSEDNEVFDLLASGGGFPLGIQKLKQADTGIRGKGLRGGETFAVGFKNSFDHVLDIAGIEIAKALDQTIDATTDAALDIQIKAISDYANGMRGLFSSQAAGVSSSQRYKEAQWMLAARYRRAVASLYAMALSSTPERSYLAGKAIVNLTTGTALAAVSIQMMASYANGDNEQETLDKVVNLMNPTSGSFLMFAAGGQKIGVGSKFVSDAKMIGKVLTFAFKKGTNKDIEDWQNFLGIEQNPGLNWVKSQLAYAPTTAISILTGKDYMGEPTFRPQESNIDSITAFTEPLGDAVIPIWMSSSIFEGGGKDGDWAGRGLRGFTEAAGMRAHPQGATEILRLAAYDYMDMPFDEMEPFQKDLLRHMLSEDLTHLQEEQVKNGTNDFAIYFNNIRRIDKEYFNTLIELTKIYPNTSEGNRNLYTAYRNAKSAVKGAKAERGYDVEFEDETKNLKSNIPSVVALAKYRLIFEKVTAPGTTAVNWEQFEIEYEKLMATLTLEQQITVTRNSMDTPLPKEFMDRLATVGKKEYRRILQAQRLRLQYFEAQGRPELAEQMNQYHYGLKD